MKLNDLRLLRQHPLNAPLGLRGMWRYLQLGLRARLGQKQFEFAYLADSRLRASTRSTSAQLQYYNGLNDLEEMAFLLHFLGPDDLFLDVGANIGAYTILAAKVAHSAVVALEPASESLFWLRSNVALNKVQDRVDLHQAAAGAQRGSIQFTQSFDAINRVARQSDRAGQLATVPVVPLDELLGGRVPSLAKIDVEGFELPVLQGAAHTLAQSGLLAILIETNGLAAQYGFDEAEVHRILAKNGFERYTYNPHTRMLSPSQSNMHLDNSLYLRDVALVRQRLLSAPAFSIRGRQF